MQVTLVYIVPILGASACPCYPCGWMEQKPSSLLTITHHLLHLDPQGDYRRGLVGDHFESLELSRCTVLVGVWQGGFVLSASLEIYFVTIYCPSQVRQTLGIILKRKRSSLHRIRHRSISAAWFLSSEGARLWSIKVKNMFCKPNSILMADFFRSPPPPLLSRFELDEHKPITDLFLPAINPTYILIPFVNYG